MPMIDLQKATEIQLAGGASARVVHTGNVSVANVDLKAGAIVPEHAHHHEQIVNVVEGELELIVDGSPISVTPGKVFVLPPMTRHSARALVDSKVVDVFHPVREDYR